MNQIQFEEEDLTDPFVTGEDDTMFDNSKKKSVFTLDSESEEIQTQTIPLIPQIIKSTPISKNKSSVKSSSKFSSEKETDDFDKIPTVIPSFSINDQEQKKENKHNKKVRKPATYISPLHKVNTPTKVRDIPHNTKEETESQTNNTISNIEQEHIFSIDDSSSYEIDFMKKNNKENNKNIEKDNNIKYNNPFEINDNLETEDSYNNISFDNNQSTFKQNDTNNQIKNNKNRVNNQTKNKMNNTKNSKADNNNKVDTNNNKEETNYNKEDTNNNNTIDNNNNKVDNENNNNNKKIDNNNNQIENNNNQNTTNNSLNISIKKNQNEKASLRKQNNQPINNLTITSINHKSPGSPKKSSPQRLNGKHRPPIPKIPQQYHVPPLEIPNNFSQSNIFSSFEESISNYLNNSLDFLSESFLNEFKSAYLSHFDINPIIDRFSKSLHSEVNSLIHDQFENLKTEQLQYNHFLNFFQNNFNLPLLPTSNSHVYHSPLSKSTLSPEISSQNYYKSHTNSTVSTLIQDISKSKNNFIQQFQPKIQSFRKNLLAIQEFRLQEKQNQHSSKGKRKKILQLEHELKILELNIEEETINFNKEVLSSRNSSFGYLDQNNDQVPKIPYQVSNIISKLQRSMKDQNSLNNTLQHFSEQAKVKNFGINQLLNEFGVKLNSLYEEFHNMELRRQIQNIPTNLPLNVNFHNERTVSNDNFSEKLEEIRKKRKEVNQEFNNFYDF